MNIIPTAQKSDKETKEQSDKVNKSPRLRHPLTSAKGGSDSGGQGRL